jgi:hypothetical protein
MPSKHDRELEQFKRAIDLVEYAKKAGYEPRPLDGALGLTVLDHPNRDRIVVGQSPGGPWIYASVPDYALRPQSEPAEHALERLRSTINRSQDKGTIVEFVQQRDPLASRWQVALDQVRERLRDFCATGRSLDFEGPLRAPPYGGGRDRSPDSPRDRPSQGAPVASRPGNPELNQRRYDWSPPIPSAPRETQVDQRLRQWREAQATLDRKVIGAREVAPTRSPPASAAPPRAHDPRGPSSPDRPPGNRNETPAPERKHELNRRRYDWTPEPPGLEAIRRATRSRSPDRDR